MYFFDCTNILFRMDIDEQVYEEAFAIKVMILKIIIITFRSSYNGLLKYPKDQPTNRRTWGFIGKLPILMIILL